MLRSAPRTLPYSGPTLKLNGPTLRESSKNWTIPSTVNVGDYLFIACNNSCTITNDTGQGGYRWNQLEGRYGSASYFASTRCFIKIATLQDINTTYTLDASGYAFIAHAYVFTNPNRTSLGYAAQANGYIFQTQYWQSKSTAGPLATDTVTRTQFTFPASPAKYGPNRLRIFYAQMNGNDGTVNPSWSSGLTGTRTSNDSYWWMGLGSAFITNATGLETPTIYFNRGGAVAWNSLYLP